MGVQVSPPAPKCMNKFESIVNSKEASNEEDFTSIRNQIFKEAEQLSINKEDRNSDGELLVSPGGSVSKLGQEGEKYWKIARTNAFKKWFGDWQSLSNTDLDNWHTHKDLKQLEEELEHLRYTWGTEKNLDTNKNYQERLQSILHAISALNSKLVNNNFNIHKINTISKTIDENGEPMLLHRATEYLPREDGLLEINENKQVGIFVGNKAEATYQLGSNKDTKKIISCFANIKNYKLYNQKPSYWDWRDRDKTELNKLKQKYDGLIVKNISGGKSSSNNYIDILVFDPKNILITEIKND